MLKLQTIGSWFIFVALNLLLFIGLRVISVLSYLLLLEQLQGDGRIIVHSLIVQLTHILIVVKCYELSFKQKIWFSLLTVLFSVIIDVKDIWDWGYLISSLAQASTPLARAQCR